MTFSGNTTSLGAAPPRSPMTCRAILPPDSFAMSAPWRLRNQRGQFSWGEGSDL